MNKAEHLQIAKDKVPLLFLNTSLRITGEEESYYVYNLKSVYYIGTLISDNLPNFFQDKEVFTLVDKNTKPIARLQKLY
jgi:hypothetical protein